MSSLPINWNPSRRELQWFAGLVIPFCAAVAGWWWNRAGGTTGPTILAIIGSMLGLIGLAKPEAIRWLYLGWMIAVWPIGAAVSYVLLALIFFGVIMPIGLLLRLFGSDPMRRSFDRSANSYWIARPSDSTDTQRYFRQF